MTDPTTITGMSTVIGQDNETSIEMMENGSPVAVAVAYTPQPTGGLEEVTRTNPENNGNVTSVNINVAL